MSVVNNALNAPLPLAFSQGGTGADLVASNGGILYSNATTGAVLSGTATADQMLLSGASGAPTWSTVTHPATTTINQILYSSAANVLSGLATANNGALITSSGGVPSISSTLPSAVQGNITSVGTITSGTWNGSSIDLSHGGTNASLTASNGGIFYSTASAGAILAGTATANEVLVSGSSSAPSWSTLSSLIDTVFGSAQGDILYRGASSWAVLAPGTSGQFLETQGASANPQWSSPASGLSYTNVSGTSQTMVANNGYFANNAGLVTFTLPTTAAFGTIMVVKGYGIGGWTIVQNSGQNIVFGDVATTVTSGSLSSTNQNDDVTLFCAVANTTWTVLGGPLGNLTVV